MRKLFALLLAVLMVISMAACTANEPATTTTPKATTPATQPSNTVAATTMEPVKALNELPFVESGSVVLTVGIPINATVMDYEDNAYTKYLEEKTGIDLKFTFFSSDAGEAKQQLNLMVAGKEKLPDIIFNIVDGGLAPELADMDLLVDLAPYFETSSYWFAEENASMSPASAAKVWSRVTNADGNVYIFPSYSLSSGSADNASFLGGISKTMAKNVGMDAEEIDTVAEVYEFLKRTVKEDGNKNGESDELGLVIAMQSGYRANILEWVINAYVYCNDAYFWNITDGELWSPYDTDEYRKAMIELNKWYQEGLISPLCFSITNYGEMNALLETPDSYKVSIFGGHTSLIGNTDSKLGEEYTGLHVLQAETDKGGYAVFRDRETVTQSAVITTYCEEPELAFRLLDFMIEDGAAHASRFGEEGVNWKHIDGVALGLKDADGRPAGYEVIKDEWSTETKATWHADTINFSGNETSYAAGVDHGGVPFAIESGSGTEIMYSCLYNYMEGKVPEEVCLSPSMVSEEGQEAYDTLRTPFRNFVREARAQFITGVLDPSDDVVWEAYVKELELNGQSDLMAAYQEAYTALLEYVN